MLKKEHRSIPSQRPRTAINNGRMFGRRMFRKVPHLIAGLLFGSVAVFGLTQQGIVAGGYANAQVSETYRQLNLFGTIFEAILSQYVDQKLPAELIGAAINGLLEVLDPNSRYYTPEEYQAYQAGISGQFGGLGIQITMEDGLVLVITPIDDSPASRAGIIAGDLIIAIDGQPVEGMTLEDTVNLMRGPPGTAITITVQREGLDEPFDVGLVRAIIQTPQVRTQIFDDIAYIRLTVFGPQTDEEFAEAVVEIIDEIGRDQVSGVILDLRNNGGGLLDTAVAITDDLLDRGEIVSMRGRISEETLSFFAQPGDLTDGLPLIVLMNGGSASASEIVAGALQDLRRATVIGSLSFGKGSVQRIFQLGPDLGAIRLTTNLYYTPSGRSIHNVGLEPDIVIEQPIPLSILEEIPEEDIPVDEDGNPITDIDLIPADPAEDTQLQYALRLLRGEEVHPAFPAVQSRGVLQ